MMKCRISISSIRPTAGLAALPSIRPWLVARSYATQNTLGTTTPKPKRQTVTPFNDDGFVPWKDLSTGEKAARAKQQSFNFGFIAIAVVLTGGVTYVLWTDIFSPDSKIAHFNRAVDRIKKDPRCLELLGDAKKIRAHGEETFNKWRRARPVASSDTVDKYGTEHLVMNFHMDGNKNNGIVQLHMVKRRNQSDFEYKYLYLDVRGHERVYLENAETSGKGPGSKTLSLFGVKWG